jgi:hypothetical protein
MIAMPRRRPWPCRRVVGTARIVAHGASAGNRNRGRIVLRIGRVERAGRSLAVKFLLWLILLVICWPLALLALLLYPLVWVLTLPFRLVGIAVEGVFGVLRAVVTLPGRLLGATR